MLNKKLLTPIAIISVVAVVLSVMSVVGAVSDIKKYEIKETNEFHYSRIGGENDTEEDFWGNYDATLTASDASGENAATNNAGAAVTGGQGGQVSQGGPGGQASVNVSSWDKTTIIAKLREAITKTKAYRGNITVNHKESFTANVTECTVGALGQKVANFLVESVVKPTEEVYSYTNGRTTTAEGENVEMLLPKNGAFTLTPDGAKDVSVSSENGGYVIKITLVPESVGMYDVPKHNAAAIGYLDVASINTSYMTVTNAKIDYKGSTIEAHINLDGYVTSAVYNIPLHAYGAAEALGINGEANFDGQQTEIWKINW